MTSSATSSRRSWATCSPSSKLNNGPPLALWPLSHLLLDGLPQTRLYVLRDCLRLHSLINLQGLQSSIYNHKTVGALVDMRCEMDLNFGVYVRVEIIVELLKKLFTGNQANRPLSA